MAIVDWIFDSNELGADIEEARGVVATLLILGKIMHPVHWHLQEIRGAELAVEKSGIIQGLSAEVVRLSLFGRPSIVLTYPSAENEQEEDAMLVYSYLERLGIFCDRARLIRDRGCVPVVSVGPPKVPTGYIPPQMRGAVAGGMVLVERKMTEILRNKGEFGLENWELDAWGRRRSSEFAKWHPYMELPASILYSGRVANPGSFPSYYPWFWQFNGKNLAGEGGMLSRPGFTLPHWDASLLEMIEAGYEPVTYNPYASMAIRELDGTVYREGKKLFGEMMAKGAQYTLTSAEEVAAEGLRGWVVPKVQGDFFEGKSFDGIEYGPPGEIRRTPTLMTPKPVAASLESMFG